MVGYSASCILHIIHTLFVWVETSQLVLYFTVYLELAAMWIINYAILCVRMLSACIQRVVTSQTTYEWQHLIGQRQDSTEYPWWFYIRILNADTKHGVAEATRMADFTVWPSNDNNNRIDFGNSDVEVITTHSKDIWENSDVKIDDALTEWDIMIKSNLYGRQVEAGELKYVPYIYFWIRSTYSLICLCNIRDISRLTQR